MAGEQTPLLISRSESDVSRPQRTGSASVSQTVVNIAKTCMGTGTLALPFAARRGGLILHLLGLIAILAWNLYSVQRLLGCLELLPINKQGPPEGTATLGRVAWYALGRNGLYALDVMMVILLCGIIITYEDAIMSFLQGTPFSTGTLTLDAIGISVLIGLLSIVPDMGYLAKASATGLTVLFLTFCVIAWYGDYKGMVWNWWPQEGMSGVSTWFGCVVFGFGVVPLTFNMQEAMEEPSRMIGASFQGFAAVAVTYAVLGLGLLLLYPDVDGDVLQELPTTGILPTAVRLAMVVVVMATAPLLVVPCGELLEGKIVVPETAMLLLQVLVRLGICVLCSFISVFVPGFVDVLSFVGCFCVALPLILLHESERSCRQRKDLSHTPLLLAARRTPESWLDQARAKLLHGLGRAREGDLETGQALMATSFLMKERALNFHRGRVLPNCEAANVVMDTSPFTTMVTSDDLDGSLPRVLLMLLAIPRACKEDAQSIVDIAIESADVLIRVADEELNLAPVCVTHALAF